MEYKNFLYKKYYTLLDKIERVLKIYLNNENIKFDIKTILGKHWKNTFLLKLLQQNF